MANEQAYAPKPGPVQDDPRLTEIVQWTQRELESIGRQFTNFNILQQNELFREPEKPRIGMTVYADGTHWDPGAGPGQYVYDGTAWVLSSTGPVDTSLYLQKGNNLSDLTNVSLAQDNLNLQPGVDVMAYDAQLFSNIPQNSKSAAYTTLATDAQKHIFHPSADTTARSWTIDNSLSYAIGTAITFVNQNAGGVITIILSSGTMRLAGAGTTGNRTLAANGMATALKISSTDWIISGTGLT